MSAKKSKNIIFGKKPRVTRVDHVPLDFTHGKDGRLIKRDDAKKDFISAVNANKRDKLLQDFPQIQLPTSKWRNEFAQTALELSQNEQTADWRLLLTGCAVAWADDRKLQKHSRQQFAYTLNKIHMAVPDIHPVDQAYIDAVKNGVKVALFNRREPYRATHLLDKTNNHVFSRVKNRINRLFSFTAAAESMLISKRASNRYKHALKKHTDNQQPLQLESLLIVDDGAPQI